MDAAKRVVVEKVLWGVVGEVAVQALVDDYFEGK